ncbi:MAG: hypothetical protein DRG78_01980 [Epsilonproteobacteria bacterium]|nr:MAG: hypothetical protein DRG78_01980 [Campylobacterota bacterium]
MSDYQTKYKKEYNEKNKIVTIPLKNIYYEELKRRSLYYDLSVNTYAKNVITNFLNEDTTSLISPAKKEFISKYIQISRGIANNINQIAHKSNMDENIDINILIKSLQHYETEFKNFISKM